MKTYKELQEEYSFNKIPYPVLLDTHEWLERRTEIIIRDNCTCQICNRNKELRYPNVLDRRCRSDGSVYLVHKIPLSTTALSEEYNLHVHHKRYVENWLPWEYKDDDLITYCPDCHKKWHEENKVKYYVQDENGNLKEEVYQTCYSCDGTGYLPQYKHVDNGICFKCGGRTFLVIEK